MKKKYIWTWDAWSTNHLFQQISKPVYYIVYCWNSCTPSTLVHVRVDTRCNLFDNFQSSDRTTFAKECEQDNVKLWATLISWSRGATYNFCFWCWNIVKVFNFLSKNQNAFTSSKSITMWFNSNCPNKMSYIHFHFNWTNIGQCDENILWEPFFHLCWKLQIANGTQFCQMIFSLYC